MRARRLLAAGAALLAGAAVAADSFKDVKYVSGKAGFSKKVAGVLTIDEQNVGFSDEKGRPIASRASMQETRSPGRARDG